MTQKYKIQIMEKAREKNYFDFYVPHEHRDAFDLTLRDRNFLRSVQLLKGSSLKIIDDQLTVDDLKVMKNSQLDLKDFTIVKFAEHDTPSISGVEILTELQELYIHDTLIRDLTPLAKLEKLIKVDCSNTYVSDLAPLGKLEKLVKVSCSNTLVRNLEPLRRLTTLRYLYLADNDIEDLAPLSKLVNLDSLYISNNPKIKSLAPLENLKRLKTLICENLPITSLDVLKKLPIEKLGIYGVQLEDLTPLKEMTKLKALRVKTINSDLKEELRANGVKFHPDLPKKK